MLHEIAARANEEIKVQNVVLEGMFVYFILMILITLLYRNILFMCCLLFVVCLV